MLLDILIAVSTLSQRLYTKCTLCSLQCYLINSQTHTSAKRNDISTANVELILLDFLITVIPKVLLSQRLYEPYVHYTHSSVIY